VVEPAAGLICRQVLTAANVHDGAAGVELMHEEPQGPSGVRRFGLWIGPHRSGVLGRRKHPGPAGRTAASRQGTSRRSSGTLPRSTAYRSTGRRRRAALGRCLALPRSLLAPPNVK
jgi:hypothetical protein